jgi:hypothetical protein
VHNNICVTLFRYFGTPELLAIIDTMLESVYDAGKSVMLFLEQDRLFLILLL